MYVLTNLLGNLSHVIRKDMSPTSNYVHDQQRHHVRHPARPGGLAYLAGWVRYRKAKGLLPSLSDMQIHRVCLSLPSRTGRRCVTTCRFRVPVTKRSRATTHVHPHSRRGTSTIIWDISGKIKLGTMIRGVRERGGVVLFLDNVSFRENIPVGLHL